MTGDARTHAALAVEHALTEADRQRILGKFHHTGLDGADVADILDILDNHDALLNLREPFYDGGSADQAWQQLGWRQLDWKGESIAYDYEHALRAALISYSCLAVALLTDAVPTLGPVTRLAGKAATVAAERWPEGEYR